MQALGRYCKGHTIKCAGCIIRIELCGEKVILTYGLRSGCDLCVSCLTECLDFTANDLDS